MTGVNTGATTRRVGELITAIRDLTLIPNHDFQRRLVWSTTHKAEFIQTVLMGLPFPEVFVAQGEVDTDTGDSIEWLVDGQQRLTTLAAYFAGTLDLNYQKFSLHPYVELDETAKKRFLQYQVAVRDLGAVELADVVVIFRRINSTGYSLNAMEVNNSRFDGPLKRLAEDVSNWEEFESNKVFTSQDAKRMADLGFCLSLIITMMSAYFNRDAEHEAYLDRFNDSFDESDDIERRLRRSVECLHEQSFAPSSRAWRKADLFTLLIEIDRILESGSSPDFEGLRSFFDKVDAVHKATRAGENTDVVADGRVLQYIDSAIQGVNDRGNRQRRGQILGEVLGDSAANDTATTT